MIFPFFWHFPHQIFMFSIRMSSEMHGDFSIFFFLTFPIPNFYVLNKMSLRRAMIFPFPTPNFFMFSIKCLLKRVMISSIFFYSSHTKCFMFSIKMSSKMHSDFSIFFFLTFSTPNFYVFNTMSSETRNDFFHFFWHFPHQIFMFSIKISSKTRGDFSIFFSTFPTPNILCFQQKMENIFAWSPPK